MDELDELLSQAIDAGASDADLQEITRLYYARTGVKKKEPSRPYSGVGSMDYSPNAPVEKVNPLTSSISAAKQKAAQPVEQKPVKDSMFEMEEPVSTGFYESMEAATPKSKEGIDKAMADPKFRAYTAKKIEERAVSYAQNSPKNSDQFDIGAIEQGENSPTTPDRLKAENDRILYNNSLVQDQIDYLWNTGKQDEANQLKETFDDLKSEYSKGLGLKSEKYREIITNAQAWKNENVKNELFVLDNKYKIKDFYKSNANTLSELSMIDATLATELPAERRNSLEAQRKALMGVVSTEMSNRGLTPEVLGAYQSTANKYADPNTAFAKATTMSLAADESEAEREKEIKRKAIERINSYPSVTNMILKPLVAVEQAGEAFGGAVLDGVLSIAQSPKVLGDLLGDTDNDFIDSMYTSLEGLKSEIGRETATPFEDEDTPTYVNLSRIFGSAAGSMALMAGGGQAAQILRNTSNAARAGSFGTTMLMQMSGNYEDALRSGMDQQEAALFGTWSSVLSAAVEQIVPEGAPPMNMTRLRDAIKEGVKGKELLDVANNTIREYSKNAAKEIGEENFEQFTADLNKAAFGFNPNEIFNSKDYVDATLGALMLGGAMTAFRGPKKNPQMIAEAMYDMVGVPESELPKMPKEDIAAYKSLAKVRMGLEMLPNWNNMDRNERVIAFDKAREIHDLEMAQKQTGVDQSSNIEVLQNELNEMVGQATPTEQEAVQGNSWVDVEIADLEKKRDEELRKTEIKDDKGLVVSNAFEQPQSLEADRIRKKYEMKIADVRSRSGVETKAETLTTTPTEQVNVEKTVPELRAQEQAELDSKIENADQYRVDGKVDRAKLTNEADIKAFDEVYDKYDKLITPLLEQEKAGSVGVVDVKQQELDAQKINKESGVDIYVARQGVEADGGKYTLSQINENGNTNTFLIEDANGNEVGKAQLSADGNFLENIRIDEKHRRKGLASKVYDFIELRKGIELEPSPNKQSKEAKALWDNRNLKKVTEQSLKETTKAGQVEQTTTTIDEAAGEGVEGVNVSAVTDGQSQQPTDENMGGDNASDLGGQGLQARGGTTQGGVEAARESRPINEQRRVLSEVDEEIGRIIYGDLGNEGGSVPSDIEGQGVVSASGTDGGVLPVDQGADTNIDAAGGSNVEPSGVDIQGEGLPDVEELKTKSKTVRAKLESAVNDLLSKVKAFNSLPLKAMGARQNLRKEIDKLSKTYGLNVVEENLKLGITDKKGKRIASRGSRVNAANDNKIFEKARRVDDNTDAYTLALISVYEGIKLAPQVAADLLGTGQYSAEYRTLQELGMIDEKAGQGGGMGAIEEIADRVRKEGNNVTDSEYADALAEAIGIASMAKGKTIAQKKAFYKEMIKRTVIANAKKRKENLERDAESIMVDSEIGSIISKAKEDFDTFLEGLNETERAEAINDKENILWDSVQRDLRKSEALEGKDIDGYARASFDKVMAEDMAVSNEQVYEYGDEYDFSEGGEDAPFQETTDLGAIAINTFNDVYDRLGIVEATKAANEVIGNDADARKDFVDYVKATRETLLSGKPFEKKKVVVSSPKTFREALKEIVPQISDADADSLVIIGEAMVAYAKKLDPSLTSEYLWGKVQGVMSNDIENVKAKGATSLEEGITAYAATADVSTLIHEPSHNLLGLIDELAKDGNEKAIEAQNTIEKHVEKEGEAFFDRSKKAGEKWAQGEYNPNDPTMRQELFARSAEKYFMEGTKAGFSAKMNAIFESFAKMLKDIYKKALNSPELINLSPEMRSLMDAIYGKEKVEKDLSKNNLKKGLYNTIQRFIDDSNYSDEVKEALKNRPESLAPIDNEKDRLALTDTIIEQYGLEAVLAESMKASSEIPQELQGFVFMRALEKLDRDRKKLKGKELEALEEEYLDIHFALGEKMLRAGQFTASMARIYYSRPDVIVKNAEKKINAGNKQANEEADAVIDEVEKILNTEEDQEAIVEDTFDILDALKQQKQIEARITKLSSTKRAIGKATKQVEKVAVATGAGIAMNMTKAARSVRKAELKKMLLGDQLNSGLPVNKIPVFAEYIALTIADGVTDLVTIIKDFRKDGIVDQDHLIAEAYKDVRNQLIADGVPVELISDEGIDATLELLRKEDKRLAEEIKALEIEKRKEKLYKRMSSSIVDSKSKSLLDEAIEIDAMEGGNTMSDLVGEFLEIKESDKKAAQNASRIKRFEKRIRGEKSDVKERKTIEQEANELDAEMGTTRFTDMLNQKKALDQKAKEDRVNDRDIVAFSNKIKMDNPNVKPTAKEKQDLRKEAERLDKLNNTTWFTDSLDSLIEAKRQRAELRELAKEQDALFEMSLPKVSNPKQKKDREADMRKRAADMDAKIGGTYYTDLIEAKLQDEANVKAENKKQSKANADFKRLYSMMGSANPNMPKDKRTRDEKMQALANEIDAQNGNTKANDLLAQYRLTKRNFKDYIEEGLIAAGFEMKDSLGNPTGKVNWKAVVKDSKNTDETVLKIMTALEGQVSPSELDAIRAALTTAITQAVNERKASQIEAMVRARQRNADRKARGLFSRQRNIDRLSDAINVAGGDMNKITDIIADMFGVQKFTPEQSSRLKDLMEKRNAAAEKGQGNLVAKYEQEIQAIIHYKEFPYLSGDKIGSDLMNSMLASIITSAQNATTVFDGAFYTPIFDFLFAQFSGLKAKGVGDRQIRKVIAKAYTKAFWSALDQGWNGNIDIISAQYEITGNKQSTPSIDFTERTRYKYGEKTAISAADNFKQKFVRFYKRLNNAFDAFGMAVNAETKMYLVLKAQFIGEGMSASEASKAAFDTLYSKDMDELRNEILADNPKMGKIEVERTAYSMLESKLAQTVVRQGQLEAAINTGKIPEVGVLSGIGYFIDKMLKGSTTALNAWSDKAQNPATKTVVQMIKVVNKLIGSISTAFLYPTLRFAELSLKYLPISPIALGYQAGRFTALALYSSMSDQAKADRVFNTHRWLKDFGRSVIGYVVVQALISSLDDDDEEDELVGFGPRDIPTKMNEMEVRKLESLNGVSLKFYGPFAMGLYLEAAGLDAKRYGQKPITTTELALLMTTSQYGDRINGIIRDLTSEGDKWKKVVGNISSNAMMLVNPWSRTMNDIAGTMTPKVKNITFSDYLKKGLGLNILNDNQATDFMGNTMDLGQMAAYSLDGVKKSFEDFEGKDQDVKDWISENGATGFQRTYKSDEVGGNFLEIGSEQVYELTKAADVLRGTALRSLYADREIFESVKPAIYENLTPSKKDAVDKAALVRFEVDKNKSVEQHREDVLVDWAKQISIDSEVSEINTAAKYVARYDWIMMNGKMEEADKSWVDNEKYNKYIKLLSM